MTDREKVVKGLESLRDICNAKSNMATGNGKVAWAGYANTADDALALLKEQEPVKPTISVDTWICSKCGHTLESQELIDDKENPQVLIHEQYQYCPNYGRAVKWDE